jgi:hypothetical protein
MIWTPLWFESSFREYATASGPLSRSRLLRGNQKARFSGAKNGPKPQAGEVDIPGLI